PGGLVVDRLANDGELGLDVAARRFALGHSERLASPLGQAQPCGVGRALVTLQIRIPDYDLEPLTHIDSITYYPKGAIRPESVLVAQCEEATAPGPPGAVAAPASTSPAPYRRESPGPPSLRAVARS